MKINGNLISIVFLVPVLAFAACKRAQDPIGAAASSVAGDPQYTVVASRHETSGSAVISDVAPFPLEQQSLSGDKLYAKVCLACHQATGAGIPGAFPPLDDSLYVTGDVERLAAIMVYGLVGPIKVKGVQYASAMAPLGATNSDEELAAIATYIRSAWSNKAGPVSPDKFAEVRKKWGSRGPFSISELGEEG